MRVQRSACSVMQCSALRAQIPAREKIRTQTQIAQLGCIKLFNINIALKWKHRHDKKQSFIKYSHQSIRTYRGGRGAGSGGARSPSAKALRRMIALATTYIAKNGCTSAVVKYLFKRFYSVRN